MTPTSLEFCVESFIEDLNLSSPQESEFYVILEEMQYLKLTLLQEGFLERQQNPTVGGFKLEVTLIKKVKSK